jgi:DNA-binding response OmpR family regulator
LDVLLVDDDRETVELVRTFLENNGHTVQDAGTAREALEKIAARPPRLLLLDIRLPDRDGREVLTEVRAKYPQVAVVMMTGFKEAELVVEAFRHGAMDCLLKPFNFDYLKNHILGRLVP